MNVSEVLSAGQKQLLCLARALLCNNRIVILDEATASVDLETDRLVHHCIHAHFKGRTIINIVHKLNTIADYDKILVLRNGKLVEKGTPLQLLKLEGRFHELVDNSGNASVIRAIIMAKDTR